MKTTTILRKTTWALLTGAATLSIGLLSFAGMLALSAPLLLSGGAFIFAIAYEAQVNGEGISEGLQRWLDPDYLKAKLAEACLNKLAQESTGITHADNLFLNDYKKQKDYIKRLKQEINRLEKLEQSYLRLVDIEENKKRKQAHRDLHARENELQKANRRLRRLQLFFIAALNKPNSEQCSNLEQAAKKLLDSMEQQKLLKQIKRKKLLIRASWLIAIGAGISSGLTTLSTLASSIATLSSVKIGILSLSFLSAIPGGALVALSALAGVGCAFLIYQSVTDMIQKYHKNWKKYFHREENESQWKHGLRCTLVGLGIVIAFLATLATAGTWWVAMKRGEQMLGVIKNAATALSTITVSLFVAGSVLFNSYNSAISLDKVSRSDYKKFFTDIWDGASLAYHTENTIRFLNPFRLVERIISGTATAVFYLVHCIVMGVSSDGADGVPPALSAATNAFMDGAVDAPYMGSMINTEHDHSHDSKLLKLLFAPATITVGILKFFSACWDYGFSSNDFKKSLKKMFCISEKETITEASSQSCTANTAEPTLSADWYTHELTTVCDKQSKKFTGKPQEKHITGIKKTAEMTLANESKPTLLTQNPHFLIGNKNSSFNRKMDKAISRYNVGMKLLARP